MGRVIQANFQLPECQFCGDPVDNRKTTICDMCEDVQPKVKLDSFKAGIMLQRLLDTFYEIRILDSTNVDNFTPGVTIKVSSGRTQIIESGQTLLEALTRVYERSLR